MSYSTAELRAYAAMQARLIDILLRRDTRLFSRYYGEQTGYGAATDPALERMRAFGVLFYLRDELFDHILPRIVRRLSFASPRTSTIEEPPARGRVNWERTLAASWAERPGETPLALHTQQRRRDFATPENLLTIATLLEYRADIQTLLWNDSALSDLEALRHPLAEIAERCDRELAFPQFAGLRAGVEQVLEREGSAALEAAVAGGASGGNSAYADLIAWRERRRELHLLDRQPETAPTPTLGADPARDNYLYQLWLFYELLELLDTSGRLQHWDIEKMRLMYRWEGRAYVLAHDRAIPDEAVLWQHAPGVRPDFFIAHADRQTVRDADGALIWQEPGYVLDAKYYRPISDDPKNPAGPIKRMIADLQLTGQRYGALLFGFHGQQPADEAHRLIAPRQQQAQYIQPDTQIVPLQIAPILEQDALHRHLERLLAQVDRALAERVPVRCHALAFEPLLANAHGLLEHTAGLATRTGDPTDLPDLLLCPKPHIAPWRVDLVSRSRDCCTNSQVCHIIGQPGIRPPQPLDTLNDITSALRPPADGSDEDQVIDAANEQVLAITRRYARLLQPDIASYRGWIRQQLDIGELFDATPLLTDAQRETLALGRFLWEQIDHIRATNLAGPALLFSGVLEELARATVFRVSPPLIHHQTRRELMKTLGTLGNAGRYQRDDNYRLLAGAVAPRWHPEEALPFNRWLMLINSIADLRNRAAHEAHIDPRAFEEFVRCYFGSTRTGVGALNGLLLAWQ